MRLLHVTLPVVGLLASLDLVDLAGGGGTAHAEVFGEVEAGIANPIGDSDWTNLASTSFKLAGRLGFASPEGPGAALQLDWTPIHIHGQPPNGIDVSASRIRMLPTFVYHHPIAPKLALSARLGVGLDYIHESASFTVLGATTTSTSSDTAFAFELGGGVWYDLGAVELGGELALPISAHSDKNTAHYSSYDIDVLVGLRFTSRGR
jgi:hypothetical protein